MTVPRPHPPPTPGATIPNEAILASAGSGKTFQLAHRFIRLLAHGVEPNRIIAITFSRQAAGEIFTAIVTHLRAAAASEEEAQAAAERIACPGLTVNDFLAILRRFLDDLQRMHISTIDSFTIGILRAFPMELGISPLFDVAASDSPEAQRARTEVLTRLFREQRNDPESQRELMEAFKQATHGRESKTFAREFDQFITDYQEYYKLVPDAEAWGRPARIWPGGCDGLQPVPDIADVIASLRTDIQSGDWNDFARNKWNKFLNAVEHYNPSTPWSEISYVAELLLDQSTSLARGEGQIKMQRTTYSVSGPVAQRMGRVVQHIMHQTLTAATQSTQGIHRLLDQFEQRYDTQIRRPGLITFDDAQFLIIQGGRPLSREPDDPARLHIDFRLDSQLDHWLVDEFQDTSDLQWEVLRNLADEVLQDAEGRRSFFFVGDVKQAIYAWRGGNHKLFGHILNQYGNHIEQRPLNTSFRSAQAVLDAVNETFNRLPEEVPQPVQEQWTTYWGEHQCREDKAPPPGHMALIEAGEDKGDHAACYQACAAILREIDPLRRGLTVAVLVRQNKTAWAVANTLRAACPDMPVAIEGASELADNPVVLLLLALVQYAAHPGDTLAREHLRMSPLHAVLTAQTATPTALLAGIYRDGYQPFLRHWGAELDAAHPLDDFGRHRLLALIDAAGEFDQTGVIHPDAFLEHMRAYTVPEQAADSTIRVMTMHKSKGLGFDIVLLPELTSEIIAGVETGIHIARDTEGQPQWALLMPNKGIRQQDPVLQRETEKKSHDATFEHLCTLYVALTRAKRGLYCISTPPPKTTPGSLNFASFLRLQLGGAKNAQPAEQRPLDGTGYGVIYEQGPRDWFTDCAPPTGQSGTPRQPFPARFPRKKSKRRRLLSVSPSSRAEEPRPAHLLFALTVTRSLNLGTAVHGLFEQVDWSDTTHEDDAVAQWREVTREPDEEAVEHFKQAYRSPAFQAALAKPEGHVTLWREKMFEAVIDDEWITGTFDRVVIVRNDEGAVVRAEILDFKTNDVTEENLSDVCDHYRPQLTLYAKALSKLIGYPHEQIARSLLFTRPGRVEDIGGGETAR